MNKVQKRVRIMYEVGFGILLLVNAVLLIYFILKLNQIESLARDTQAQAEEIINSIQDK